MQEKLNVAEAQDVTQGPHKQSCRTKGDFRSEEAVGILTGHQQTHQCSEHLHTCAWLSCTLSRTALGVYSCCFVHSLWQRAGTVVLFFPWPYHAWCSLERKLPLSVQFCSFEVKMSCIFNVSFLKLHLPVVVKHMSRHVSKLTRRPRFNPLLEMILQTHII